MTLSHQVAEALGSGIAGTAAFAIASTVKSVVREKAETRRVRIKARLAMQATKHAGPKDRAEILKALYGAEQDSQKRGRDGAI